MNAHRHLALIPALLVLASCGTTRTDEVKFAQPNDLMADEIRTRVDNITYQHRDELMSNLLWLGQAGEQAIPTLLDGLQHASPKVRSNCAWVLAQIGDRRVIPYLQPLIEDQHDTVRLEAARTLVTLGDMKHSPMLIEGLDSDRVQVRYLCHEALKDSTGRDFGYDHLSEDLEHRQRAALSWREWWGHQAGDPWFAQQYATQHGLTGETEPPSGGVGNQPSPTPMGEGDANRTEQPPQSSGSEAPKWQPMPQTDETMRSSTEQPSTSGSETPSGLGTSPSGQPESAQPSGSESTERSGNESMQPHKGESGETHESNTHNESTESPKGESADTHKGESGETHKNDTPKESGAPAHQPAPKGEGSSSGHRER